LLAIIREPAKAAGLPPGNFFSTIREFVAFSAPYWVKRRLGRYEKGERQMKTKRNQQGMAVRTKAKAGVLVSNHNQQAAA
jgi:hypothetical protein